MRAVLHEAAVSPKPGLVCPTTQGAHKDMDFSTLVASALTLAPYFVAAAELGFACANQPPEAVFGKLRPLGKEAEKNMLAVTGGVNTHRGLVFSLGILTCATARNAVLGLPLHCESVCATGADFVQGITKSDFALLTSLRQASSHDDASSCSAQDATQQDVAVQEAAQRMGRSLSAGERLFLLYGVAGVRGEAESGFPLVQLAKKEFDRWKTDWGLNVAAVHALLLLMANSTDTNVLHRGGPEALTRVQQGAYTTLRYGGLNTPQGTEALDALQFLCLKERLSPGGCADMLALVLYFYFLEHDLL